MKLASCLVFLFSLPLLAETVAKDAPSNSRDWLPLPKAEAGKTVSTEPVGRFGQAQINISTNESVAFGIEMSVSLNCGGKNFKPIEPNLRACKFERAQFDAKTNRLILHFKSTKSVAGRQECVEAESFDFQLDQHCGRK